MAYDGPVPPIIYEDVSGGVTVTTPKGAMPSPPVRAEVLDEAKNLTTGDRNKDYGDPLPNFQDTADLLTVQFRHKFKEGERFTPSDVAKIMVHVKMARMIKRNKRDNWVDIAGYAGLGAECDVRESDVPPSKRKDPFEPRVLPCATGRKQVYP